jgi:Na+/proline symporter
MNPQVILFIIAGYFLLLLAIARITGKKSDNTTFYSGNKKSPWFVVAFGMIGASLSGVTFISVPGWVGSTQFSYLQMVLGYMAGYLVIAWILMPVYYKLNVITIYDYLDKRFGISSYKTGAAFFLLSRTIGASFRLFLVAGVFHEFVFRSMGIPFAVTVIITIIMIWVYTFRGGIKTIVWTDTLQTFFMLLALVLTIVLIGRELNLSPIEIAGSVQQSPFSKIFSFSGNRHFLIQFINGAFIAIVMTGLDQDMMQKNLSIRSLKKAQKNIYWQMGMFLVINVLFLSLGALLYIYSLHQFAILTGDTTALNLQEFPNHALNYLSDKAGLASFEKFPSDNIFPMIALKYLSPVVGATFMIGLVAAAYSSADSALTSLTTTFCADFLGIKKGNEKIKTRYVVHLLFSILLLVTILIFNQIGNRAIIDQVFIAAGYTYGPLLGLFSFGLLTKRILMDKWVPVICILAPIISYLIKANEGLFFDNYTIGHELLIVNGMLTFFGLWLISRKNSILKN